MSGKINLDMVRHIGKLSRIELTDEQIETFAGQLAGILEYFGKLQELDTEDVEPLAHAVDIHNVFAADETRASLPPAEALANAPQRDGDFFKVPKVIGEGS